MILKALYDYYHRCADIAPMGMEDKEIDFLIVIDREGNLIRIEDCRNEDGVGRPYRVVKGKDSTSDIYANFLWGKGQYVLGLSDANGVKKRDMECLNSFKKVLEDALCLVPDSYELVAMKRFYENPNFIEDVKADSAWTELSKNLKATMSFLIDGENEIIASKGDIVNIYFNRIVPQKEKNIEGICLVTGKKMELATTHSKIGFPKQPGAKLVSFQKDFGFDSYGKEQGYNAPISHEAEFCYTTALKKLLSKRSKNKFMVGERAFVFWATSKNADTLMSVENAFFNTFGFSKEDDDPNRRIDLVKETFMSMLSGKRPIATEDMFYILGLYASSKGRSAIVYWQEIKLKDFVSHILAYFADVEIVARNSEGFRLGINQIVWAVSLIGPDGKTKNEEPNLPEAIMKSIIQGTPFPYSLLLSCLNRVRAEQKLEEKKKAQFYRRDMYRAAIIKAYLNRINDNNNIKLTVMLDPENKNQGYLCGRLFATLEKAQEASSNGSSNIRERYMNAASATPAAVFPTLLNLSIHHVDKLEKGLQVFYEKTKAEIMEKISPDGFPAHLDLQDQGRFMVGYYHQRQYFFTTKENKQQTNNE